MSSKINKIDEIQKGEIIFHGIPFHFFKNEIIVKILDENIKTNRENNHISITNTESMYYANKYLEHKDYIKRSTFSFCDGIGIVLAARLKGKIIRRYHGPDFMYDSCKNGQALGWRHYFFGGEPDVVKQLSNNLLKKYPRMIIAGTYSPPFRALSPFEEENMILNINQSNADILWVGLGLLKQERWIDKYKNKIKVPWKVGVGAAFDFHAGNKHRPPKWVQQFGLEWLLRMVKEPRMVPRNIRSFYQFLFIIVSNIFVNRSSK